MCYTKHDLLADFVQALAVKRWCGLIDLEKSSGGGGRWDSRLDFIVRHCDWLDGAKAAINIVTWTVLDDMTRHDNYVSLCSTAAFFVRLYVAHRGVRSFSLACLLLCVQCFGGFAHPISHDVLIAVCERLGVHTTE